MGCFLGPHLPMLLTVYHLSYCIGNRGTMSDLATTRPPASSTELVLNKSVNSWTHLARNASTNFVFLLNGDTLTNIGGKMFQPTGNKCHALLLPEILCKALLAREPWVGVFYKAINNNLHPPSTSTFHLLAKYKQGTAGFFRKAHATSLHLPWRGLCP